jgi:gliding motility-associated-like protein
MKVLFNSILVPLLILCYTTVCHATHIVGGDISYECLGLNNATGNMRFKIIMHVYRDYVNGAAPFDNPAVIGIYSGNNSNNVFNRLELYNPTVSTIPIDLGNPCLIAPQNLGVEEGFYEGIVELPFESSGYSISYQRCCRNNTINNLINPSIEGGTYTIFLSAIAQQQCNSSPSFNAFPPVLICVDKPLSFDHSAADIDGDSLVYEFCTPFHGGGQAGAGFTNPAPDPPAPPPYQVIQFSPGFSALNPMVANPAMSIDSNTGLLTGVPTIQGQYVVGVCVKEYDALGNLLSLTLRDFQFNVAICENQVHTKVTADSIDFTTDHYYVESCGDSIVTFDNTSSIQSYITDYEWRIDLGNGNIFTSSAFEPTLIFPGNGVYSGWLIANPGTSGCTDTALISVSVSLELSADFNMTYDPCEIGPISFYNLTAQSVNTPISNYSWTFGDGNFSSLADPAHLYTYPDTGLRSITLRAEDVTGCIATVTKELNWTPKPIFPLSLDNTISCVPVDANTFQSIYYPIPGYKFTWDFGDGNTSNEVFGNYTYTIPGIYNRKLTVLSPAGCSQSFSSQHTALESPKADFSYSPSELTSFKTFVEFTDLSENAALWEWHFGNNDSKVSSFGGDIEYNYQDTGKQEVTLMITHRNGCTNTAIQILDIVPKITFFLPNALTPNDDGSNDVYMGKGHTTFIKSFDMSIYNRWGERIFQTSNVNEAWNGRKNNTGQQAPNGVYIAVVSIEDTRGNKQEVKGFATVIR